MRKRRFCRIDKDGCIACGGRTFERRAVISDALASAWGLSARERADFDEREGHACATARCRSESECFFGAFEGSFRFPADFALCTSIRSIISARPCAHLEM